MHLSREMRFNETEDLSSWRGDRDRSPFRARKTDVQCNKSHPRAELWRCDVLIVLGAFSSFAILGSFGSWLAVYAGTPQMFFTDESVFLQQLKILYWARTVASIGGRLVGDLLCGMFLGFFLRHINPWHAFAVLAAVPTMILLSNGFFWNADDGTWVAAVGATVAAGQICLKFGFMLGTVALGIWCGQRQKRRRTK